jgi:hypothetical protein
MGQQNPRLYERKGQDLAPCVGSALLQGRLNLADIRAVLELVAANRHLERELAAADARRSHSPHR